MPTVQRSSAMRTVLSSVPMDGIVVIGEGEKDNAPMLFNGEKIGDGTPPMTDIAVDPIDGTTLTAQGRGGALAVIAVAERGAMFDPGPCVYMEKLAVGPRAKGACDIRRTPTENLHALSEALGRPVRDLTAVILDRPRHDALVAEVRSTGARIRLISDGDVAGAIATGWPGAGTDILFGIGGNARGRDRSRRPQVHGRRDPGPALPAQRERSAPRPLEAGYALDAVLTTDDLVQGNNCFFAATGITDGELLQGVQYHEFGATTQSLVMRSKSGHAPEDRRQPRVEQAGRVLVNLLRLIRTPAERVRPPESLGGGVVGGHGNAQLGPGQRTFGVGQLQVLVDVLRGRASPRG